MRNAPMTVHMRTVENWWERVQYRSPHSPEFIAEREQMNAERREYEAKRDTRSYEQKVRDRLAKKRAK